MAIKPKFLASMGYHIFLIMVLRARAPSPYNYLSSVNEMLQELQWAELAVMSTTKLMRSHSLLLNIINSPTFQEQLDPL